jgi:integrase
VTRGPEKRTVVTRFTATQIAALPPRSAPYTDPGQPGLQLLVRARAEKPPSRSWLLRFKFKGEETRILLGHFPETTLDQARGDARQLRELASQGIDPRQARSRRRTVRSTLPLSAVARGSLHSIEFLASEFMERYVRPHRKVPAYAQAILERDVLPEWKGRDARTVSPTEVIELLDKIVERGSPVAAPRTAALLSQMFRFGIHRRIVAATPVQLLMRPGGKEKPRERVLTDGELQVFLKDPIRCTRFTRLAHVITILLLTGQRRGELAGSRWTDIDFKERTWSIRDELSKTGRGHVVPLTDTALSEFRALKMHAGRSPWVLSDGANGNLDPKQLTRSLAKCLERFKKQGVRRQLYLPVATFISSGLWASSLVPP